MAAVLWASGISFGGVLSFLYADLIVLPLLDVYRRYYGWRMAAYIAAVFYVTMVLAGLIMDVGFTAAGLVLEPNPNIRAELTTLQLQLYVLAQSRFRCARRLFRLAQLATTHGSRARAPSGPARCR